MGINLGDKVRDTITGFTGIAIARTQWIHGCTRFTVQPSVDKDGKVPDAYTFDEPQLELIEVKNPPVAVAKTGGPQNDRAALRRD